MAVDWAAAEGWNPGLHDASAFFVADPKGFFVGVLDGQPVASISAVTYSPAFAFVGFYIVRPEMRGQGYGLRLWQYALSQMRVSNIGLDGVPDQVPNYERSGSTVTYRNLRFVGKGRSELNPRSGLVSLDNVPFETLLAYDSALFPAPRLSFLRAWIALPESDGLAVMENENLRGYGVIRRCRTGYKVGPIFADSQAIAEQLFAGLTGTIEPDAHVYLDIPEINGAALRIAEYHGLARSFETARMYTNGMPAVHLSRVFGGSTLELG